MPTTTSHPTSPPAAVMPVRFSVSEFDRLLQTDVLPVAGANRLALHRGELILMTPPSPLHDDVVEMLSRWAFLALLDRLDEVSVRVQLSMNCIEQASVPLPDLALVKAQSYSARRPVPEDIFLLIEVSDSSLAYDIGEKMRLYADAGIPEYWIVDIPHRNLIVHTDPADGRYRHVQTFDENQDVSARFVPAVAASLKVADVFR